FDPILRLLHHLRRAVHCTPMLQKKRIEIVDGLPQRRGRTLVERQSYWCRSTDLHKEASDIVEAPLLLGPVERLDDDRAWSGRGPRENRSRHGELENNGVELRWAQFGEGVEELVTHHGSPTERPSWRC